MFGAVVARRNTVLACLIKKLSAETSKSLLLLIVSTSGPNMSVLTYSRALGAKNNSGLCGVREA